MCAKPDSFLPIADSTNLGEIKFPLTEWRRSLPTSRWRSSFGTMAYGGNANDEWRTNFVDYYGILQVSPNCDAKLLESAYHHLAKRYHPDHTTTSDVAKFGQVIEAYGILRDPEKRAEYDLLHAQHCDAEYLNFPSTSEDGIEEASALDDADDHARILMYLYRRRRENAQDAGVVGFYLQDMLQCSHEHFEFHKWYLKEKGYIVLTEQGTLAITIQGIDHVISLSRISKAEKLLISQSSTPPETAADGD